MTHTRIKLTGPADNNARPLTVDMTPAWAGLMPALLAMLESGDTEGRQIARAELLRLARDVDAANAAKLSK